MAVRRMTPRLQCLLIERRALVARIAEVDAAIDALPREAVYLDLQTLRMHDAPGPSRVLVRAGMP